MLGVVYNNTSSDLLTHHHINMMITTTKKKPTSQKHHFNVLSCVSVHKNQNPSLKSSSSKDPFLKSFSSNVPESENPPPSISITVDYLVNSCGLSPEKALSLANKKKFNICSVEKADSVISLFQSYGFTKTHITKIFTVCPELLHYDPNKTLKPKFDFLCDLGVSEQDLIKLIASYPTFLCYSLNNQIIPCFNFLKDFMDTDAGIMLVLKRYPNIFSYNLEKVLKPNISILQVHNVPDCNIAQMFIRNPRILGSNSNRFKEIVKKIKIMGFDPSSPMFCKAVDTMAGINESSWDKKLMVYREFGFSESDVIYAFKKQPNCMNISEENIRKSLKFFVEKLNCKPTDISCRPVLLSLSLEKRIIPRCAVLKILYKKGTIRKKLNLYTVFNMDEKAFSEKFVIKYCESVPEVVEAYKGGIEFVGFEEVVEVKGVSIKPGLVSVLVRDGKIDK